jgi:hypothetical protein
MAVLHEGDFAGISSNGLQYLLQLDNELAQIKAAINQLITDFNAHTHGGVTTGAGATAAPTATTAVAVVAGEVAGTDVAPPPS